jgi:hypothetical protein
MSTIHLHQTTTSTPAQYVAGLSDFGLRRHLVTPALRLVRSQPRCPHDGRLSRWFDRLRRGRRTRRQEPQGTAARLRTRDHILEKTPSRTPARRSPL